MAIVVDTVRSFFLSFANLRKAAMQLWKHIIISKMTAIWKGDRYIYRAYGALVTHGKYSTVGSLMCSITGSVQVSGWIYENGLSFIV